MPPNYDTTIERHKLIIDELNFRNKVHINHLVHITGASKRTLQLDLSNRLKYIYNIETDKIGNYWIEKSHKDLFTVEDLNLFFKNIGFENILPEFDTKLLNTIIRNDSSGISFIINKFDYQLKNKELFKYIIDAIENKSNIFLRYNNLTRDVSPYKLIYTKGFWYLHAVENSKLKTYKFNKIKGVSKNNNNFNFNELIFKKIEDSQTIWIEGSQLDRKREVLIKTIPSFTEYYKNNIIIPGEISRFDEEDGSLTIKFQVDFYEEILSIIKFWIPRIYVVEPIDLKELLMKELQTYLHKI
ncbi:MAG: hypothetical protein B6I17_03595 [Tenericutes bacterium 4572_104]|nr:MAG: hypothetical protein B6I17_03595 [Tenericutes bacterium 4572_104]